MEQQHSQASSFKRWSTPAVKILTSGLMTSPSPVARMDSLTVDEQNNNNNRHHPIHNTHIETQHRSLSISSDNNSSTKNKNNNTESSRHPRQTKSPLHHPPPEAVVAELPEQPSSSHNHRHPNLHVQTNNNNQMNTSSHNNNINPSSTALFSPVLTPSIGVGGTTTMVLLSPSRTIAESLTALATATGHALEAIWDELGYSPHERATEISDLLQQLKVVCETKLSDEQRFLNTYQQTILDTKREIQTTRAALQLDNENIDENDRTTTTKTPPQTLIDELATLEASLDGLRSIAVAAKDDLKECLATIEEAHDALGIDLDENWRDVESDLSAGRIQLFHEKRGEMKKELTTRMAAVIQLVRDCQQMMEDLRMNIEDGEHQTEETNNESSVLEHQLNRRIAGSLVRSKDGSFIMASKFRSETCVGINAMALEELMRHAAFLHSEKRRRKETLQIMGSEIAVLWEKLRIPEEEQRAFTNSVQGLGLDTIQKGEEELQRLQTIKLEQIGTLIGEARETIQYLWDQTDTPQEYRDEFAALHMRTNNGTVESELALLNDDLLKAHEEYISILQARLDQMKPILRLIERREAVVRDRLEYEDLQKDSDRLKQRGAAMTKQLMAEEKMAKRIKRDLPKLTELLLEALSEWKQVHQEDFHFKGEVYLDAMARQETDWKAYKAEEMHRKLKKKQDEKSLVDNRFQQPQPKKRPNTKPLGDNTNHAATAAAVFRVSKPINNDTAQSYLLSKPAAAPQLRTAQSHDDAEFVAAREENALPARWMGEKHPSTRF